MRPPLFITPLYAHLDALPLSIGWRSFLGMAPSDGYRKCYEFQEIFQFFASKIFIMSKNHNIQNFKTFFLCLVPFYCHIR